MVPRFLREQHAEYAFIVRYTFRHSQRAMGCVSVLMFLQFAVMFIPCDWLALADRHVADYAYLVANRPEFADAYVGGVGVQLAIVFVVDRARLYLVWISFAIAFSAFCSFSLATMTDFDLSAGVSWFADNPEARRKFMPLAPNSSAFLMTGLFLAGGAFAPMIAIQTFMIVLFGRRVKFNDIKGESIYG